MGSNTELTSKGNSQGGGGSGDGDDGEADGMVMMMMIMMMMMMMVRMMVMMEENLRRPGETPSRLEQSRGLQEQCLQEEK